ncbi:hypothetical protein C8J56DRAFT_893677 [Mycena floridula]|nr:hypothetical protein C8J56DRAFT_893677 [Mycena floridula]
MLSRMTWSNNPFHSPVASMDGNYHSIQLYSDITAEWISAVRSNIAEWTTVQTKQSLYHQCRRQSPEAMTEHSDMAEDGTVVQSTMAYKHLVNAIRNQFSQSGMLLDTQDLNSRPIDDNNLFVAFGLAVDLGNIVTSTSSVMWALGLVRDPVVQWFTESAEVQFRHSYFWTRYSIISDAVDSFLADYPNALQRAITLDAKLMGEAQQVSSDYVSLVSIAVRQTLAATDFTVSQTKNGGWDMSDIYQTQTAFYASRAIGAPKYGLPFDSDVQIAKAPCRLDIIQCCYDYDASISRRPGVNGSYLSQDSTIYGVSPASYDMTTGSSFSPGGQASAGLGATFSLISLNLQRTVVTIHQKSKLNVAAIAGGTVAGVIALLLLIGLFFWYR